jgi:hypothetical protein
MIRWDGDKESLAATLYQARPDVFPVSTSSPIPDEMPAVSNSDIQNLLQVSHLMHGTEWDGTCDPIGTSTEIF